MLVYSQLACLAFLIFLSAFFSSAEIALASARKTRLQALADEGNHKAAAVIDLQEHPGQFFSALQVGTNAVALLGGIVGDAAFSPFFIWFLSFFVPPNALVQTGFVLSFLLSTGLFVMFADLLPKRLALLCPEAVAMKEVGLMKVFIACLKPIVKVLEYCSDAILSLLGLPTKRAEVITSEDILASVEAGTAAGLLAPKEEEVIFNVFELESRLVPSAMTPRDDIVYLNLDDTEENIRNKISTVPYNRFLICDKDLDHVIGYVDSKHLLRCVLEGKKISFKDHGIIEPLQFIPDSLTLSEALETFQRTKTDFAVIVNEYAFVVGILTINDVMSTVMGNLVTNADELQIVQRDKNSWLVDGTTPVDDLERTLDLESLPEDSTYETVAGFMIYMLRKIPKRTDKVTFAQYSFEVIDVDNNRVDQVLVTRIPELVD